MISAQAEVSYVVTALKTSTKYHAVCDDLLVRVARDELHRAHGVKDAIKNCKNTLHRVGAAYFVDKPNYPAWLGVLSQILPPSAGRASPQLVAAVSQLLTHHASTRERLPIVEEFYRTIFHELGATRTILDVASGLNPLSRIWMPLATSCSYIATDIFNDMMAFINSVFTSWKVAGHAISCDCSRVETGTAHDVFEQSFDVAFLLKCLPVMEMVERGAAARLLSALKTRHMVISYPVASLGGKHRNMTANYELQFQALIAGRGWVAKKLLFPSELVFVVKCR